MVVIERKGQKMIVPFTCFKQDYENLGWNYIEDLEEKTKVQKEVKEEKKTIVTQVTKVDNIKKKGLKGE